MKINKGFTLAEVLVAVAIVGVIAALTIPSIVTHFNDDMSQKKYERLVNTIQSVLDTLAVTENKQNFGETSMYNAPLEIDYEGTAGNFIKKHLKISRYYGDFNNDDNKKKILNNAFGEQYWEFSDKDKKEVDISTLLQGACAQLKNGVSICLSPQTARTPGKGVKGWVDINGPQGPNVLGRDLREIKFDVVDFKTSEDISKGMETIATASNPNLTPVPFCSEDDVSVYCCTELAKAGDIIDQDHPCCDYEGLPSDFLKHAPICAKELTLALDHYPTSSCTAGMWAAGKCNPHTRTDNKARIYVVPGDWTGSSKPSNALDDIPLTPPNVFLFCSNDGKKFYKTGYMEGVLLKQAILSNTETYNYTLAPGADFDAAVAANAECKYSGQKRGLQGSGASAVFIRQKPGYDPVYSRDTEKDGVLWHINLN